RCKPSVRTFVSTSASFATYPSSDNASVVVPRRIARWAIELAASICRAANCVNPRTDNATPNAAAAFVTSPNPPRRFLKFRSTVDSDRFIRPVALSIRWPILAISDLNCSVSAMTRATKAPTSSLAILAFPFRLVRHWVECGHERLRRLVLGRRLCDVRVQHKLTERQLLSLLSSSDVVLLLQNRGRAIVRSHFAERLDCRVVTKLPCLLGCQLLEEQI